ncbi:MAG: glycosyltransferase [Candidatus Gracilibacteria bacterium]|jgi:glycosyltransferase involved in cell wall biosynthesis
MLDSLKIAIVCDWLTVAGGAERVILEMHELFPRAPIFTTVFDENECKAFKGADVRAAFKWIPFARKMHRVLFPLMPAAFERMDLSEYDLVLSSCHSASKGVITRPETLHICYCHSPMRYVWDRSQSYRAGFKRFAPFEPLYSPILHNIRMWDRVAAERPDKFLSNSSYISERIKKYYGRESTVLYPPVDLSRFSAFSARADAGAQGTHGTQGTHGDYYLAVGRLIPYKRFDLVIEAARQVGRPLKIVGEGPEYSALRKLVRACPASAVAHKAKVEFLGKINDEDLKSVYQNAKALIFPQVEDFGIVPLEAMASGTPVIAYGMGGALETVVDGVSGLFFDEQTPESLAKAIRKFEKSHWDSACVAASVEKFSAPRFRAELRHYLEEAWAKHQKSS